VTPTRRGRERVDPNVEREAAELESAARAHPCHGCPDRAKHERWAERSSELRRRIEGIELRIGTRTETLARQFDHVLAVLVDLGYLDGWTLEPKGRMLTRIYGDGDIVVAEALAEDIFEGLSSAETAALVSTMVYESRERTPVERDMPTAATRERLERLRGIRHRVRRAEDAHGVQLCRDLEAGFAPPVFHWTEGKPLDDVLAETEMAPGDFVRNCKQLADLLRQIEDVALPPISQLMRSAREAVVRGVVAYTGV